MSVAAVACREALVALRRKEVSDSRAAVRKWTDAYEGAYTEEARKVLKGQKEYAEEVLASALRKYDRAMGVAS